MATSSVATCVKIHPRRRRKRRRRQTRRPKAPRRLISARVARPRALPSWLHTGASTAVGLHGLHAAPPVRVGAAAWTPTRHEAPAWTASASVSFDDASASAPRCPLPRRPEPRYFCNARSPVRCDANHAAGARRQITGQGPLGPAVPRPHVQGAFCASRAPLTGLAEDGHGWR